MTSFCALADRYMECFKTYTRGCVGFYFGEGSLTELQNIALYCCNGITSSRDCPFNPNVPHKCFDAEAMATMADGSKKSLKSLEIGDKVKTLDENGQLADTDVVMIMDTSDQTSLFFNIQTYSNKTLRVSGNHLISTPGGQYKFAKKLMRDELIVTYDFAKNAQAEEKILSILIEPVTGYVAPLTMSGHMLVNDIAASCYAVVDSHWIAHSIMAPVRWWYALNSGLSLPETTQIERQMNGTHWYPLMLQHLTEQYINKLVPVF